jgi:hypothetical protein
MSKNETMLMSCGSTGINASSPQIKFQPLLLKKKKKETKLPSIFKLIKKMHLERKEINRVHRWKPQKSS